ncbi:hypothetical protein PQX77_018156 [Marasmius sp. AFHP31]|nr:hypothetical protein PQX77_018156 [Marasmius sp. AFHP31]
MIPLVFITALNLVTLAIADLASDFSGVGIEALFPGKAGFESATEAYNRRFTFTPSAVAYAKSAEEVSKVVRMGGGNGMKVVARSVTSLTASAVKMAPWSLSNMKGLSVDSASNVATIETGNRLGDVAVELNEKGRALPHGTCPYVGIGGHSGPPRRIPLIRNNNPHRHPNPVPTYSIIFSYTWELDTQTASQALLDFQSFVTNTSDLPPEFGGGLTLSKGTTEGKLSFTLLGGWYGSQGTKLDQVLAPFLGRMPKPDNEARLGNGTYIDSVKELGGGLDTSSKADTRDTFHTRSLMTPVGEPLSEDAVGRFVRYLSEEGWRSDTSWFMQIELYGGPNSKVNAVPVDESAFVRRDTLFTWQLYASSSNNEPPYPEEGFTFVDGAVNSIVGDRNDSSAYMYYVDDRLDIWDLIVSKKHSHSLGDHRAALPCLDIHTHQLRHPHYHDRPPHSQKSTSPDDREPLSVASHAQNA